MESSQPNPISPKQPRRTRSEWQSIVEEHQTSGLTAQEFCKRHNLAYQSLLKWRSVLSKESQPSPATNSIEFTPSHPINQPHSSSNSGWDIEIEVGPAMTLRIRQNP